MRNRVMVAFALSTLSILALLTTLAIYPSPSLEMNVLAKPIVLLVSLDGFRNDYLQHAPTLSQLAADGLRAEYMDPVFPVFS